MRYGKYILISEDTILKMEEFFNKHGHISLKIFFQALKTIMPEFKHQTPKGGMFLYGAFEDKKIDTFALVQDCLKKKVVYVPANQFYIDKVPNSEIRFNYTHSSFEQIEKGLKLIKSCL